MCSSIQLKLYQMEDFWFSDKTDEVQRHVDRNDVNKFYDGVKGI